MTGKGLLEPKFIESQFNRICKPRGYHTVGDLREQHGRNWMKAILVCKDCGFQLTKKEILSIRLIENIGR